MHTTFQQNSLGPFTEELIRDFALIQFRCFPSYYLHQSWREYFVDALWCDEVFDSQWSQQVLSEYILENLDLSTEDLSTVQLFPALLLALEFFNQTLFEQLVFQIGAILHQKLIRQALSNRDVMHWKQVLGEQFYEFICRQGGLLGCERWQIPINSVSHQEFYIRALMIGNVFLRDACIYLPQTFQKRFLLKLPRTIDQEKPNILVQKAGESVWLWILRVLKLKKTYELKG